MGRQGEKLSTTTIYTRSYIGVGFDILLGVPNFLLLISIEGGADNLSHFSDIL